ncbi:MAG: Ribosome-recycling factor [Parcubacteria group bacterium GW2011_GWA1_40_21]|nr:MAG: Ribosome-recycling factor [Parcubacteria group bacterium GW2011_GWC1_40_13]KKR53868.1 MAG: Ribosome-recycling factor [Parcubacteria group bacterium GW2011_GWA1_40_21]
MLYDFSKLKSKTKEVEEWLKKEYTGIRTGMAAPALLDSVVVESYGSRMGIKEMASVSIEDARSLRVSPWDISQVAAIEKAITLANLGVSIRADEKGLRVLFPELTTERRTALVKVANAKLEEARVSLRSARDEVWSEIQKKERDGEMGEDDKFRLKTEMQKIIDDASKKLEEVVAKKDKEIMS